MCQTEAAHSKLLFTLSDRAYSCCPSEHRPAFDRYLDSLTRLSIKVRADEGGVTVTYGSTSGPAVLWKGSLRQVT